MRLRLLYPLVAAAILAALLSSCASTDCATCIDPKPADDSTESRPVYNVELRDGEYIASQCGAPTQLLSLHSVMPPDSLPAVDDRGPLMRIRLWCDDKGANVEYLIPYSRVKRVTNTANPLIPPVVYEPKLPCICCERERKGWWIFDKVEARLSAGYRPTAADITYLSPDGTQTTYTSSLFSTGRGGSNIVAGAEFAGLWSLDRTDKMQLGVLAGVWPVDGSVFIPVAAHGRYTFTPHPDPYQPQCDTWYAYADAGLPLEFSSGASIFGPSFERQRYFWGLGFGRDFAVSKDMDFSIDLGLRQMNLPLPEIECCPDVSQDYRNPFRLSTMFMFRVGLTW